MSYLRAAAGVISLTVILIAAIAIPHDKVDVPLAFAVVILAAACALPIWGPSLLTGASRTNAGTIGSIGISGSNFVVFLGLALLALALGLFVESRTPVWVADIGAIGWLVAISFITRGAIGYIDQFAERKAAGASLSEIQVQLERLAAASDTECRARLEKLSEAIRFSPSDSTDGQLENNELLDLVKGGLAEAVTSKDTAKQQEAMQKINVALAQRNARLIAMRSKA